MKKLIAYLKIGVIYIQIYSYQEGAYSENGIQYRAGFDRKQNIYYAALKGTNINIPQQVLTNNITTGIKGMFLNVQLKEKDNSGGAKQLFSVGSTYNNR